MLRPVNRLSPEILHQEHAQQLFFAFLVILTYVHFLEVGHLIFYYYEIHVI